MDKSNSGRIQEKEDDFEWRNIHDCSWLINKLEGVLVSISDEDKIYKKKKSVDDLIEALEALSRDFSQNKDSWENVSIDRYFESVSAWLRDSRKFTGRKKLSYEDVFNIMISGKYYE